ncbi:hypothetical protein HGRIS_007814 [Hohenbuehelia grisea]|uniref:Acyl carrier protein n=1 Tax=Hohenbuehelia grisea TaxID=104357 RepID=A0ABR3J602_9AGAR
MSFFSRAIRTAALPRRALATSFPQRQNLFRARFSAASGGLERDVVEARVLDVLKGFEKVDPAKLTTSASFAKDLGLDSLDAVEVVMAVEEEFSIEIPDQEADEIQTVAQAIEYIAKTPEAR